MFRKFRSVLHFHLRRWKMKKKLFTLSLDCLLACCPPLLCDWKRKERRKKKSRNLSLKIEEKEEEQQQRKEKKLKCEGKKIKKVLSGYGRGGGGWKIFSLNEGKKMLRTTRRFFFINYDFSRVSRKETSQLCCHVRLIHFCFHWSSSSWNQHRTSWPLKSETFFTWRHIVITNNKLEASTNI